MTVTSEFFMPPPAGARDAVTDQFVAECGEAYFFVKGMSWDKESMRAAIEFALTGKADGCTCPSGDGSLHWPCPQHPATQPAATGAGELPPMEAPLPTRADAEASIDGALSDALKAVNVLSTMLRKANLQGFAVADEIAGSIVHAQKMRSALAAQPAPVDTSTNQHWIDRAEAKLAAQPAPVVGGSDWYAEQHARDSKELRKLCESRDFYKRRCDSLQALQPNMRDPERKAVCDILANGTTTALSTRPAESVAQGGDVES